MKQGKRKKIIYPSELFFFLYVSLNFPYVAQLCASNLDKHIKKITASFGVDYFLPLPLHKPLRFHPVIVIDRTQVLSPMITADNDYIISRLPVILLLECLQTCAR